MIVLQKPTIDDLRTICANAAPEDRHEWGVTHFGGWDAELVATECSLYLDGAAHVFREADGTPYCASGFYASSPCVARGWTIRTEAWKRHLRECVRVSRFVMDELLKSPGVNRLEAWCPIWAQRWPEAIGLEKEGVLRHYGSDGTDFVMWSRVRN